MTIKKHSTGSEVSRVETSRSTQRQDNFDKILLGLSMSSQILNCYQLARRVVDFPHIVGIDSLNALNIICMVSFVNNMMQLLLKNVPKINKDWD